MNGLAKPLKGVFISRLGDITLCRAGSENGRRLYAAPPASITADELAAAILANAGQAHRNLVQHLGALLGKTQPSFDEAAFFRASGYAGQGEPSPHDPPAPLPDAVVGRETR